MFLLLSFQTRKIQKMYYFIFLYKIHGTVAPIFIENWKTIIILLSAVHKLRDHFLLLFLRVGTEIAAFLCTPLTGEKTWSKT